MEQWLIHALGKVLCLYGDPQWAVVGKIVFPEFFKDTPDSRVPEYQTKTGVYSEGCGLDNIDLSWGHEALYMIRTMFEWVRKFNPYDLYSKSLRAAQTCRGEAVLRRAGSSQLVERPSRRP